MVTSQVSTFIDTLSANCRKVIEGKKQDEENPPKVLYHFTDAEGFKGIVTKKTIWASLATALNDCKEVQHGIDLAQELLRERLKQERTVYDEALQTYLSDPWAGPLEPKPEFPAFVFSFCKRCTKSGQWLHYARSGRGGRHWFLTGYRRGSWFRTRQDRLQPDDSEGENAPVDRCRCHDGRARMGGLG